MALEQPQRARSGRPLRPTPLLRQQWKLVTADLVLLVVALVLDVLATVDPGPWPGDVASSRWLQHLLLPHKTLALLLSQMSSITWPIPSLITVLSVFTLLVLLRRWLDMLLTALVASLGSGSMYLTNQVVQRPRPFDHGLYIERHIVDFFSFPSGHVQHVVTFFGFLLFLTFQTRRSVPWLWPLRAALLALLVLIGPSRILTGEHWTSDVLQGYLYGAFWLIGGIYLYRWAGQRWPRLLAPGERPVAPHSSGRG